MENHIDRPEMQQALGEGFGESTRYSSTLGQEMMYVAIPFEIDGTVAGIARVALPTSEVDESVNRIMATIGIVMGIMTVVSVLMALYLARITARPIKEVTAAVKRISAGQIDQTIRARTKDETAELASAFNEMAHNLKSMIGNLSTETNKLKAVLETMDDGVLMTDIHGIIIMANLAAGKMFGFAPDAVAGRRLMEVILDSEVNAVFKSYLKTGHQQSVQIDQTSTGRLLRVIASGISYHEGVGALLMFQDLTEVRRLQTIRQKFIANISHELRTPLASIKAVTDTLSEGIVSDPEMARDFLNRIDTEIDRMTQIVRELAELSRIETGQMALKPAPIELGPFLKECVSSLKPQADRKHITLAASIETGFPSIQAESERIQQVLINLIHNAIKFTPEGGSVTVSAKSEGNSVVISVADNGVDLPHVFERFYKVDKARSGEGTGLGLAIAKHIIRAHGGEIWVESEFEQGSTFSFRLPVSPEI
jgi:two-component system phosphate regulon sensor histidine kinase PhoR